LDELAGIGELRRTYGASGSIFFGLPVLTDWANFCHASGVEGGREEWVE
jgi:hypothetical protein